MKAYALANLKGGAGKTTSAVCLANELARRGQAVLVVDWDPQGTASGWVAERGPSAKMLARGELPDVHRSPAYSGETERVDLVAADRGLAEASSSTAATIARHLEEYIDAASSGYDVALVDCPPDAGPLVLSAMMATGGVLVPVEAGPGAIEGLHHTREVISQTGAGDLEGVWGSRVDVRTTLDQKTPEHIRDVLGPIEDGGPACETFIREAVAMREAQAAGQWPAEYEAGMTPVQDFSDLTTELFPQTTPET
jgi:chromosome partitioning protein